MRSFVSRSVMVSIAVVLSFSVSALASKPEAAAGQDSFDAFWKEFSSAVIAGNKASVTKMTKFPLSMPYGVKAVKNEKEFERRHGEIFNGEANAAQCFARAKPQKESERIYGVYCPFKKTPNDLENAPVRFIFELTKTGWKFTGLDNINE